MIYSFHHSTFWMKGGIEASLGYRAKLFRDLGLDAKFVFTNEFPEGNVQKETSFLGFRDSEVIWIYSFFTDCKTFSFTYRLKQLENTFLGENFIFSRNGNTVKYQFPDLNIYYLVFLTDDRSDFVRTVAMISNGNMVRKDYYTHCRNYTEYYIPVDRNAHLYLRRFYNEDGSIAYEEQEVEGTVLYKFPDRLLYTKEELVEYMMHCLHLTEKDVVLIDGGDGVIDRAVFIRNAFPAKIGFIIHTDHFLYKDEDHILWFDWFEYAFSHPEQISFFVTSTEEQRNLLREEFQKYKGLDVRVEAIPAAYLDQIRMPEKDRKRHSLITAGRLDSDKRVYLIIEAAAIARREIPDLTLDIYGRGKYESKLREQIHALDCGDYVHLCGFQKMDEIYQNYEAYISASFGETFGITLMEAVGSGLPVVGFDRRYGMQVFVDEEENGYKILYASAQGLAEGIIRLFTEADLDAFRRHSYKKARNYLEEKVGNKWKEILM